MAQRDGSLYMVQGDGSLAPFTFLWFDAGKGKAGDSYAKKGERKERKSR